MNKNGDPSPGFVITIIIVLVTAAILFFAIAQINKGQNEEELKLACATSINLRALPGAGGYVPLHCTPAKICFTTKGERCPDFAGETATRIDLPSDPDKAAEIIEETAANAMFDCWDMTGRGKLDVFPRGVGTTVADKLFGLSFEDFKITEPKCIVCSRLAFAPDIYENERYDENTGQTFIVDSIRSKVDVNDYMANHNVPGSSLTYLQMFAGDSGVRSYADLDKQPVDSADSLLNVKIPPSDQLAFIFMQIKTDDKNAFKVGTDVASTVLQGEVLFAGGLLMTSAGRSVIATGGLPGIIAGIVGGTAVAASTGGYAAYQAHESQLVAAGYCGEFTSQNEAKLGCSVVKGTYWDADSINQLCGGNAEGDL